MLGLGFRVQGRKFLVGRSHGVTPHGPQTYGFVLGRLRDRNQQALGVVRGHGFK